MTQTISRTDDYQAAVARRIHNARHAKALLLAEAALPMLAKVGGCPEDLARLDDAGWEMLARLAGTRIPSETTRALVVDYVRMMGANR